MQKSKQEHRLKLYVCHLHRLSGSWEQSRGIPGGGVHVHWPAVRTLARPLNVHLVWWNPTYLRKEETRAWMSGSLKLWRTARLTEHLKFKGQICFLPAKFSKVQLLINRGNITNLLPLCEDCYIIHHCQAKPQRHPLPRATPRLLYYRIVFGTPPASSAISTAPCDQTSTCCLFLTFLLGTWHPFPKSLIALRQAHYSSGHCLADPAHKQSS